MKIIDVHHHIIPSVYKDGLNEIGITHSGGKEITDWKVQDSLDFMKEIGIDKAYCSISEPALYPVVNINLNKAISISRKTNCFFSNMKKEYPNKFGAFALLPLPDIESSIVEAIYALDVLKLDGIGMLSNYGTQFLGNDLYEPLFKVLDERHAIIYVHPSVPQKEEKRPQYVSIDYIEEFTFQTTRAATNLILSGTLERYKNITFIFSHMGGTMPYIKWRLDHTFQKPGIFSLSVDNHIKDHWKQLKLKPSEYMKRYYFDCALSTDKVVYDAVKDISPNHILFGSDSFYASENQAKLFRKELESFLTPEELMNVYKNNAKNLFEYR